MRDVRLCIKAEHLVTVESVKLLRMLPVNVWLRMVSGG